MRSGQSCSGPDQRRRLGAAAIVGACRIWHARGQGFKSPQLHPRLEALPAVDRPRIARLGQQIGSNLLSKADPVVRHGGDAVQHRRCRRRQQRASPGRRRGPVRPRRKTGSAGHDKADHGLGHGTPCLQSQIGRDFHLQRQRTALVRAASVLPVVVRWDPLTTAVNGTLVVRPVRT